MRKLTFLCTLFLLFLSGNMSADNLRFDPDTQQDNPLPGSLNNSQYTWTSPTITAPTGFTTLRISFIQTYNNAKESSDYPFVCISEFYLYDKNGDQVTLSADNFSTNAQQSGEGPMTNICDGNTESGNYWHSSWSAKIGAHHYLEVTMPEGEYDLSEFSIGWITRRQAAAPKEIVVTTGSSHEDVTAQAAPCNITYEYTYTPAGGTEQLWFTEMIADCIPTSKMPTGTSPYGVTINTSSTTNWPANSSVPTGEGDKTYRLSCTLSNNYPFQFADSYANIDHWYKLTIGGNKYLLRYNASDTTMPLSETNMPDTGKEAYVWAFVGNPFTGFQIYNLTAGGNKILSSSTTMSGNTGSETYPLLTSLPIPNGNNTHWDVTNSTSITGENGFFLGQHGIANNRMNNRGGLAYWTGGADGGSTFLATEVTTATDIDYSCLYTEITNILTATLAPFQYTPALCTTEEFNTANQTVTTAISTNTPATTDFATVKASITALANTTTIDEAMESLVDNTYFTLCNVQHNTDYLTIIGESSGVTTVANKAALWKLEVQDRRFKLCHVDSKRYMGDLPNANSTSVPTSDQTAGLYYLMTTSDQTENVVSFVQDLSAGETAWGLHEDNYSKIVRWYANSQGTQWTIEAKDVSVPQLATLADSYYMIYHTDEAGVEHYLQIAPDGTLSLTTTPTYSFQITKGTTFPSNETPKTEYAYYLAMNGYRLSHWSTEKGTFNTNAIADNPNGGVWHCQVLYRNIDENNKEIYGKYAIRSTNAAGTDYFANYYMTITNGQLSYAELTDETDNTLYQWEIRGGYPFKLTLDESDPNAYAIKSGRDNDQKEWWYTYTTDGKIHLNNFVGHEKNQYWYFTETKENGTHYLQFHPLAAPSKLMSYDSNHQDGANKISGQDAGATGYDNKWLFDTTNGSEPYGLKTADGTTYLSNHGGYQNNMGLYNGAPGNDGGTAMYFTAFSNPNIEWWASLCGTELGQYNITNVEELTGNINSATRAAAYFNAKDALYAAMNTESINKPTAGFYRFKGKVSGNYMDGTVHDANTDGGQMKMVSEAGKTNIFYLNENSKLLNYSNGTYLQNTRATNAVGAENGSVINFFSSEGNNYGFYTMKAVNSGSQYIYDNTNRVDRNGSYANNNCDWTIEKVDALPVTIGNAKWSTFCAPVALTIPQGMTVYYANTEEKNGTVAVKPLTDVIPANLPVLLQAEPDEYTFYISTEAGTVPMDVNSELMGTPAGKLANVVENTTYVLTVLKSTGNVGFARNNTGVMPGFKAYLQPSGENPASEYSISFSDIADGIQSVNAHEQQNTEYYDLSGRRVFFPTRGIYVTNKGEKVFIK